MKFIKSYKVFESNNDIYDLGGVQYEIIDDLDEIKRYVFTNFEINKISSLPGKFNISNRVFTIKNNSNYVIEIFKLDDDYYALRFIFSLLDLKDHINDGKVFDVINFKIDSIDNVIYCVQYFMNKKTIFK